MSGSNPGPGIVKTPTRPGATPSAGSGPKGLKEWLRRHKTEAAAGGVGVVALVALVASRHKNAGPGAVPATIVDGTGDTGQLQGQLADLQTGQGALSDQVGQLSGAVDQLGDGVPTGGKRRRPRPARPAPAAPRRRHRRAGAAPAGKVPGKRPRPHKPATPEPRPGPKHAAHRRRVYFARHHDRIVGNETTNPTRRLRRRRR